MTYNCDTNLDHLVQMVFVKFLHSKATLFHLFHTVLLGRKLILMSIQTNRVGSYALFPWGQNIYINYVEFFLDEQFVFLFNLFF